MFWKKKNGTASLNLKCQAEGCDFACGDYMILQKHTYKKHPGLKLHCEVEGCNFVCDNYFTLKKHASWKHRRLKKRKEIAPPDLRVINSTTLSPELSS